MCFFRVLLRSSGRCLFFFQAEDGIRYLTVTGVQTCALPIFPDFAAFVEVRAAIELVVDVVRGNRLSIELELKAIQDGGLPGLGFNSRGYQRRIGQIGRASCRERV